MQKSRRKDAANPNCKQTNEWTFPLGVMHSLCCSKCWGSYICFTVGWQHSALHTNRNSWAAMLGNRLIRSESNSGSCACANPNWHVASTLSPSRTLWWRPLDCLMRLSAARAALALSTSCEISANCSRLQADASMDRAPLWALIDSSGYGMRSAGKENRVK